MIAFLPWLGVAALAASWLFGLPYYVAPNYVAWAGLVFAGTALFWNAVSFRVPRRDGFIALGVLLTGLGLGLSPFDLAADQYVGFVPVFLLAIGLVAWLAAAGLGWLRSVGSTLMAAAIVFLAQRVAMFGYEAITARSHELPGPLAWVVGAIAKGLSLDAARFESTVTLHTLREVHRLGATWELLLDPASLCFLAGGVAYLALVSRRSHLSESSSRIASVWAVVKPFAIFVAAVLLWLPIRAGLLLAIYMHLGLRLDFEAEADAMILFWQPWLHGVLLAVPAVLAWRLVPMERRPAANEEQLAVAADARRGRDRYIAMALVGVAALAAGFGLWWDAIGERKGGRVLFDEFHIGHSPRTNRTIHWEPTIKPYDTEWYGQDAAYNYACIYDYLSHYYDVGRLELKNRPAEDERKELPPDSLAISQINSKVLGDCDVLVLKVPTADFSPEEVQAIEQFVRRGGGLLLVGEHTDVFGTGRHLNSVAREFGFAFRHDCLFAIDHVPSGPGTTRRTFTMPEKNDYADRPSDDEPPSVFEQLYRRPWTPHPILQDMPPLHFATSGSIEPGTSSGRAVIRSTGLWSLPADYHVDNYYPQVVWRPDMRYGAFVQLWTARHGAGRVAAFADSTIFSNFSAFQPGKAELMLGMIEWLNHRNTLFDPRPWLLAIAVAVGAAAAFFARGMTGAWILLTVISVGVFLATSPLVRAAHRLGMPTPAADESKITRVTFDRTVSDAWLPSGSFIDGKPHGFGIFERWVLRLGYFAARGENEDALRGDLLVIANPGKPVTERFRQRLVAYVEQGGKLLVLDSTAYAGSTANDLLEPFDISFAEGNGISGTLTSDRRWPEVPVTRMKEVRGGTPFLFVAGKPAGSVASYGSGKVFVLGCGDRFSDANMGITGDTVPDAEMRKVYDLQYALLRWMVDSSVSRSQSSQSSQSSQVPRDGS